MRVVLIKTISKNGHTIYHLVQAGIHEASNGLDELSHEIELLLYDSNEQESISDSGSEDTLDQCTADYQEEHQDAYHVLEIE